MRRRGRFLRQIAIATTVALCGCGGGADSGPTQSAAAEKRAYAAGVAAVRRGDDETAMGAFRAAGGYRDAPRRLAAVLRAAGTAELAAARGKLRDAHPRAAVVLVQVAMRDYGDTGPEAQALLKRAEAAQALHHHEQLAQQAQTAARQGRSTGH